MIDTATHTSVCDLAVGDLVFLSSDRVAAKVLDVRLAGSPTSSVILAYLEVDNYAAGEREVLLPVVSSVLCVPGGAT